MKSARGLQTTPVGAGNVRKQFLHVRSSSKHTRRVVSSTGNEQCGHETETRTRPRFIYRSAASNTGTKPPTRSHASSAALVGATLARPENETLLYYYYYTEEAVA